MDKFPISELSRRTGCPAETIRYYERIDILPEAKRDRLGNRLYDAASESRLNMVLRAREIGFGLEQVRDLTRLLAGGLTCDCQAGALTQRLLEESRARAAELAETIRQLESLVTSCGSTAPGECALEARLTGRLAAPAFAMRA